MVLQLKQPLSPLLAAIIGVGIALTATSCDTQETGIPVIHIDHEHYLWREDAQSYQVYQIPVTNELILDATEYEFDTSPYLYNYDWQRGEYSDIDLTPNSIQVVVWHPKNVSQSAPQVSAYQAEWPVEAQQHPINAQTLVPVGDSEPFTQFEPGQRIIISIGHLEKQPSTETDEGLYYRFWSGMIDVEKKRFWDLQ